MSEVVKITDRSKDALDMMANLTDKHIVQGFVERMVSLSKSAPKKRVRRDPKTGRYQSVKKSVHHPFGAPRLTGNLADSITMQKYPGGVWRVFTQSAKGGKGAYAIWVILGTAKMPGNDFFRRSFMKAKKDYESKEFDLG